MTALRLTMCVLLAFRALHAQNPAPPSSRAPALTGGAIAGELGAGVAGTAVGFVATGLTARWVARATGADAERAGRVALVAAFGGATLGAALGPTLVGSRGNVRGSYGAAVGGAAAGLGISYVLKRLGNRGTFGERGPLAVVAGLAMLAAPSAGATIAFNATRKPYLPR